MLEKECHRKAYREQNPGQAEEQMEKRRRPSRDQGPRPAGQGQTQKKTSGTEGLGPVHGESRNKSEQGCERGSRQNGCGPWGLRKSEHTSDHEKADLPRAQRHGRTPGRYPG